MALTIFYQLITLLLVSLVGYILGKRKLIDQTTIKGLSTILAKALMPAMLISSLQIPFNMSELTKMGIAGLGLMVIMLLGALLAFLFCKFSKLQKSETGVLMYCCSFSNILYIGKPLIEAQFGEGPLYILTGMTILFNILCFSLGIYWMQLGQKKVKASVFLLEIIKNPVIIAGILGILFYLLSIELPLPVNNFLKMLAGTITPISMLVIGFSLANTSVKSLLGDRKAYAITFLRLIASPLILYFVFRMFIHDEVVFGILMICTAMPVGASASVLCEQYDNPHVALSAKIIAISTLLCVVTIPLVFSLLKL